MCQREMPKSFLNHFLIDMHIGDKYFSKENILAAKQIIIHIKAGNVNKAQSHDVKIPTVQLTITQYLPFNELSTISNH